MFPGEIGADGQKEKRNQFPDPRLSAVNQVVKSLGAPQEPPRRLHQRDHPRVQQGGEHFHPTRQSLGHLQRILMCPSEKQAQGAGPETRKKKEARRRQVKRLMSLITMTGAAGDGMRNPRTDPPVQPASRRNAKVPRKTKNVSCVRTSSTIQRRRDHAGSVLKDTT